MIQISTKQSSRKTEKWIRKNLRGAFLAELNRYGAMGVNALAKATPVDTGLSAQSWGYRIKKERSGPRLEWYNTHAVNGTPVVILIQYGHGTRNGGYVQGRDFINPAIQPIFDRIANEIWKKVTADG